MQGSFSGLGSDDDECNESMMSQEQLAHKREFEQKRRKVRSFSFFVFPFCMQQWT